MCRDIYLVMLAGKAEEGMLLQWPGRALQAGQEAEALEGAAAACQALPASSAVWEQRLALQARHATLQVPMPALLLPFQPWYTSLAMLGCKADVIESFVHLQALAVTAMLISCHQVLACNVCNAQGLLDVV